MPGAKGDARFEEFTFDHRLDGALVGCRRDNKRRFMVRVAGGICLDTGALIAIERGSMFMLGLLEVATASGKEIAVPAGVLAQAWRGGARQARLARILAADAVTLVDFDVLTARIVGVLCAATGVNDVVDGHVVVHARRRRLAVVTSDPADIAALDPGVAIIAL